MIESEFTFSECCNHYVQFPSGRVIESEAYAGGSYQLIVTSPVEEGEYRCRVPPRYNNLACIGPYVPVESGKIKLDKVR